MAAAGEFIKRLGNEVRGLVKSAFEISYFSRGAWTYPQVLQMCQAEREIAVELIQERLKIAANSLHPIY